MHQSRIIGWAKLHGQPHPRDASEPNFPREHTFAAECGPLCPPLDHIESILKFDLVSYVSLFCLKSIADILKFDFESSVFIIYLLEDEQYLSSGMLDMYPTYL